LAPEAFIRDGKAAGRGADHSPVADYREHSNDLCVPLNLRNFLTVLVSYLINMVFGLSGFSLQACYVHVCGRVIKATNFRAVTRSDQS